MLSIPLGSLLGTPPSGAAASSGALEPSVQFPLMAQNNPGNVGEITVEGVLSGGDVGGGAGVTWRGRG